MKKKMINAAVCDARDVSEESLTGYESILINAALLLVNERAKEILNRYPVNLNVASIVEVPGGQDIQVKCVNGREEIGADADGKGVLLMANGSLIIHSVEAASTFFKIVVNGNAWMPRGARGKLQNVQVNGNTKYYPDGAVILDSNTVIDNLFVAIAKNPIYYCPGTMFFLDSDLDVDALSEKKIGFEAKKYVIANGKVNGLLPYLEETGEIQVVPNGTTFIKGNIELKPSVLRKYGSKICVSGDVIISDSESLAKMQYLYAGGTVKLDQSLEEAFADLDSNYKELKLVDPLQGIISDQTVVKIGKTIFEKYPSGVKVVDCVQVRLSDQLAPNEIMEKLRISDCVTVCCSSEQEEAVYFVSQDVTQIKVDGRDSDDNEEDRKKDPLQELSDDLDVQMINLVEYKM